MTELVGWTDGLPFKLFRAHQVLRKKLDDTFAGLGVTSSQVGMAVHLDELGNLSGSDLARLLHVSPQSTSTTLSSLERMGWVTRVPHPTHKRIIWYQLTDAGREGVRAGKQALSELQAELAETLGEDLVRDSKAALTAIVEKVEGPQPSYEPLWPTA